MRYKKMSGSLDIQVVCSFQLMCTIIVNHSQSLTDHFVNP